MQQHELPLPFPELTGDTPPLPARMVNEYVYCPRLAYLEWVQGEWADSADTTQGRHAHRRVDKASGTLPAPEEEKSADRRVRCPDCRLRHRARPDPGHIQRTRVPPCRRLAYRKLAQGLMAACRRKLATHAMRYDNRE